MNRWGWLVGGLAFFAVMVFDMIISAAVPAGLCGFASGVWLMNSAWDKPR